VIVVGAGGWAQRAWIVLLAAAAIPTTAIAEQVGCRAER
jgi:hypothetical protein